MPQTRTNRDWTANSKSTFATLGASNHTDKEREVRDFYATPEEATRKLLEQEKFSKGIWECACGVGHISKVLAENGYKVFSSDIVNRLHHIDHKIGNAVLDFLSDAPPCNGGYDIITNPPYKYAQEFVKRALNLLSEGNKCAFLLRLQFLEGQRRNTNIRQQGYYLFTGSMFMTDIPKSIQKNTTTLMCILL